MWEISPKQASYKRFLRSHPSAAMDLARYIVLLAQMLSMQSFPDIFLPTVSRILQPVIFSLSASMLCWTSHIPALNPMALPLAFGGSMTPISMVRYLSGDIWHLCSTHLSILPIQGVHGGAQHDENWHSRRKSETHIQVGVLQQTLITFIKVIISYHHNVMYPHQTVWREQWRLRWKDRVGQGG